MRLEGKMRAIDLIQQQQNGINAMIHEAMADLNDAEWTARAFPDSDLLGFTLWHIPRTQDWVVQTLIQGIAEVISDNRWQGCGGLTTAGIGAGFTRLEADEIARTTTIQDVLAYA